MFDEAGALALLKLSLRIKSTTGYDDELRLYISAVRHEFESLNVIPSDTSFKEACVCFGKAHFGQDPKEIWEKMYQNKVRQVVLRGS